MGHLNWHRVGHCLSPRVLFELVYGVHVVNRMTSGHKKPGVAFWATVALVAVLSVPLPALCTAVFRTDLRAALSEV